MTPPITLARVALGPEPADDTAEPGTGFSESALLVSDHLKLRRSERGGPKPATGYAFRMVDVYELR